VTAEYREFYRGRRVMITGGLGFIGSNLARRLVDLGAEVLLIDALLPGYGGNLFNIAGIADRVRVNINDVRMQSTMGVLARGQDVIFNLAGQVSHIDSMRDPYTDLEINCRAQLSILEACRTSATWSAPPTSTVSTRPPASTTTCSTTMSSTFVPARCASPMSTAPGS
jgi:UDP-glucose 4-epimerase